MPSKYPVVFVTAGDLVDAPSWKVAAYRELVDDATDAEVEAAVERASFSVDQ